MFKIEWQVRRESVYDYVLSVPFVPAEPDKRASNKEASPRLCYVELPSLVIDLFLICVIVLYIIVYIIIIMAQGIVLSCARQLDHVASPKILQREANE